MKGARAVAAAGYSNRYVPQGTDRSSGRGRGAGVHNRKRPIEIRESLIEILPGTSNLASLGTVYTSPAYGSLMGEDAESFEFCWRAQTSEEMSVATASPFLRKRLCEEDSWDSRNSGSGMKSSMSVKKARLLGSPAGCRSPLDSNDKLASLLAMFPLVDSQALNGVLHDCGGCLESAVQRLGEMKVEGADIYMSPQPQLQGGHKGVSPKPEIRVEEGPSCSYSMPTDQQGPTCPGPTTGEQWVQMLVTEMVAAKDMSDARSKAASILQSFEAFVKGRAVDEAYYAGFLLGVSVLVTEKLLAAKDMSDARSKAASILQCFEGFVKGRVVDETVVVQLQKDNAILKRAVQIQSSKLSERAHLEEEAGQLKQVVVQQQEKLRALEMSNYSLTLHLARATGGSSMMSSHGPDIC
eukprot:gene9085-16206_t